MMKRESEGSFFGNIYEVMCVEIREYTDFRMDEIIALYEDAGWINYVERSYMLEKAYKNSLLVMGAYENNRLVGVIRAVGDGASIVLIQDIIVLREFQRRGIGSMLMNSVIQRYKDVYQMQLMTDNTPKTIAFYKSLGFMPSDEMGCVAFLKM